MKLRPTGCWGASRRARSRRSRSAVRLARRREAGAGRTLVIPPVRAGANSARASLQLAPAAPMSELAGADAGAPGRRARRAGGQPLQGEAKVRRPRWTAREDELLRIHVASMGTTWLDLEASGQLPGRTARGAEWRWSVLVTRGCSLLTEEAGPTEGAAELRRSSTCSTWEERALRGGATDGAAAPEAGGRRGDGGSVEGRLVLHESAGSIRANDRRPGHGRPWTAALERSAATQRAATPREREQLEALGACAEGPVRVTVLTRAQRMLARGKGASSVHIGAREELPTFLASRASRPFVSGGAVGEARLMQPRECARLMGINSRSAAWREASRRLGEQALWEATADALDAHAVRVLWLNAVELAEANGHVLTGKTWRYAGMFAGALDTIFMGGRSVRGVPRLRYVAVAEACKRRLACVGAAYVIPREGRFSLASEMADRWVSPLDALSITPSCKLLSTAALTRGGAAAVERRKAAARAQLLADLEASGRVVECCRPAVILFEETDALCSHHAALYGEVQAVLRSWPYVWRDRRVDSLKLGAKHRRRRVLWAGARRQGV